LRRGKGEEGYASLTAVVLCAAVSTLCAGALTLADAQKRDEGYRLERAQQEEAFNTAILEFAVDIAMSQDPYQVSGSKSVATTAGTYQVQLKAQSEYAKWPLEKISEVSEVSLAKVTTLSRESLRARDSRDDCVRSLFSNIGQADPSKDLARGQSTLYGAVAKDGQVWRIRAAIKGHVEERRIRFLGDPAHLFALLSIERGTLGEMPECSQLKS